MANLREHGFAYDEIMEGDFFHIIEVTLAKDQAEKIKSSKESTFEDVYNSI